MSAGLVGTKYIYNDEWALKEAAILPMRACMRNQSIWGSTGSSRYANNSGRKIFRLFLEKWTTGGVWDRRARREISITLLDCLSTIFSQIKTKQLFIMECQICRRQPFSDPCFKNLFPEEMISLRHTITMIYGFWIPRTKQRKKGFTGISFHKKDVPAYRNDSQQTTS